MSLREELIREAEAAAEGFDWNEISRRKLEALEASHTRLLAFINGQGLCVEAKIGDHMYRTYTDPETLP